MDPVLPELQAPYLSDEARLAVRRHSLIPTSFRPRRRSSLGLTSYVQPDVPEPMRVHTSGVKRGAAPSLYADLDSYQIPRPTRSSATSSPSSIRASAGIGHPDEAPSPLNRPRLPTPLASLDRRSSLLRVIESERVFRDNVNIPAVASPAAFSAPHVGRPGAGQTIAHAEVRDAFRRRRSLALGDTAALQDCSEGPDPLIGAFLAPRRGPQPRSGSLSIPCEAAVESGIDDENMSG
jgi:hypothetical protein